MLRVYFSSSVPAPAQLVGGQRPGPKGGLILGISMGRRGLPAQPDIADLKGFSKPLASTHANRLLAANGLNARQPTVLIYHGWHRLALLGPRTAGVRPVAFAEE
ncbi:hypothetical protein [Hymenobacter nivis]|uniref:hypothetical protein n=1 Tax=Hymenobacter nivis TaxID=1850093 RepID=UPI00112CDC74|nr:hypothetical protein [Hymenobacter nivis]